MDVWATRPKYTSGHGWSGLWPEIGFAENLVMVLTDRRHLRTDGTYEQRVLTDRRYSRTDGTYGRNERFPPAAFWVFDYVCIPSLLLAVFSFIFSSSLFFSFTLSPPNRSPLDHVGQES